jgi:G protein-coupled receptor 157
MLTGRIFASIMSFFSLSGAFIIIISYVIFKDIRTTARLVLVHLSLADFATGLTNLIGAIVYYSGLIDNCQHHNKTHHNLSLSCNSYKNLCKAQAFFASYFTIASILWTLFLAIYVYTLVYYTYQDFGKWVIRAGYVICWGMPLLVSLWFVITSKLGNTKHGGGGWCSLRVEKRNGKLSFVTVIFGSDMWVIITFIMIFILYFSTHFHLREKIQEMKHRNIPITKFSDTKLLAIPIIFIILRSGSLLFSILFVYTDAWCYMSNSSQRFIHYWMGIGDSGEGFFNCIIFCLLTPRVFHKLCPCLLCSRSCCQKEKEVQQPLRPSETEEQRKLLEKVDVSYVIDYSTSISSNVADN